MKGKRPPDKTKAIALLHQQKRFRHMRGLLKLYPDALKFCKEYETHQGLFCRKLVRELTKSEQKQYRKAKKRQLEKLKRGVKEPYETEVASGRVKDKDPEAWGQVEWTVTQYFNWRSGKQRTVWALFENEMRAFLKNRAWLIFIEEQSLNELPSVGRQFLPVTENFTREQALEGMGKGHRDDKNQAWLFSIGKKSILGKLEAALIEPVKENGKVKKTPWAIIWRLKPLEDVAKILADGDEAGCRGFLWWLKHLGQGSYV